jgi:hypothetical protein
VELQIKCFPSSLIFSSKLNEPKGGIMETSHL